MVLSGLDRSVAEKELNLLQFAARQMAQPGTRSTKIVRSEIRYASPYGRPLDDMLDSLRRDPFAHTFPSRFIRRKTGPSAIPAELSHSSTARFAHAGTGTVRMCFPFPIRVRISSFGRNIGLLPTTSEGERCSMMW